MPSGVTGEVIKAHGVRIVDCVILQDSECIDQVQPVVTDLQEKVLSADWAKMLPSLSVAGRLGTLLVVDGRLRVRSPVPDRHVRSYGFETGRKRSILEQAIHKGAIRDADSADAGHPVCD